MHLKQTKYILPGLKKTLLKRFTTILSFIVILSCSSSAQNANSTDSTGFLFCDSHFHLTNYVQKGHYRPAVSTGNGNKSSNVQLCLVFHYSRNGLMKIPAILPLLIIYNQMRHCIITHLRMPTLQWQYKSLNKEEQAVWTR